MSVRKDVLLAKAEVLVLSAVVDVNLPRNLPKKLQRNLLKNPPNLPNLPKLLRPLKKARTAIRKRKIIKNRFQFYAGAGFFVCLTLILVLTGQRKTFILFLVVISSSLGGRNEFIGKIHESGGCYCEA